MLPAGEYTGYTGSQQELRQLLQRAAGGERTQVTQVVSRNSDSCCSVLPAGNTQVTQVVSSNSDSCCSVLPAGKYTGYTGSQQELRQLLQRAAGGGRTQVTQVVGV